MLQDILYRLLVVTCHYTSGNLFLSHPDIPRPWERNDDNDDEEE